jgi:3-deoxy-D-manno-octulosonic-acid transferase
VSGILPLYRAAGSAAVALRVPHLLLAGRPGELRERLGDVAAAAPGAVWVHAASMGEMVAAGGLIRALRAASPAPVALTAMTRTGRERARSLAPDVGPAFAPLDAVAPVRRFLDRWSPRALVLLETELWPVLLGELARRGVPWAIASARLTERGARRLRIVRGDARRVLASAAAVAARTEDDAARFRELGARADRIRVTGDLKEDREVRPWSPPPPGGPRWAAACTRPGEEAEILAVLPELARRVPAGELLLAPRHPERFGEVEGLVAASGLPWRRWGAAAPPAAGRGWRVVLVDRMGVLDEVYAASDCAFVGGSLRPFGGHSPLEAAAAGRTALVGPHTANCAGAVQRLETAGGLLRVEDAAALRDRVAELLGDPAAAERRGRAALEAVRESAGRGAATVRFLRESGVVP